MQAAIADEVILALGEQLPGWQVEAIDGQLIMSPPTGGETGRRNVALVALLQQFASAYGYVGFDSSTGFRLASGDRASPDAALIRRSAWDALSRDERKRFVPIVPDVVVELVSESDRSREAAKLVQKCPSLWVAQGVGYVVLLDPSGRELVTSWGEAPEGFPDVATALEADS